MSNVIWDTAQGQRHLGQDLADFLYENGKPTLKGGNPGIRKEHTIEEYFEKLDEIRKGAWEEYYNIAREMGWEE